MQNIEDKKRKPDKFDYVKMYNFHMKKIIWSWYTTYKLVENWNKWDKNAQTYLRLN